MAKNNPSKWYTSKENDEQRIRAYIAGNELHIEVGQSGTSDVFPPKKPWKIFTANLIYKNSTSKKRGSTMRWTILPPPWLLNFQPLNLQGAELFRSLKTGSKHIAGNHQACFGGPKSTPPGFPRISPVGWVTWFGKSWKHRPGHDQRSCDQDFQGFQDVQKVREEGKTRPASFFFLCFFCLSCTCQQENLGPTKNHVQIWRVGSPL